MIIGITGGTGCGKTTLLKEIEARGGLVLDCDAVYHELLTRDDALLNAIEARFPGTVENGQLQRKKLGSIVFVDKDALADLNTITHSAVKTVVLQQLAVAENAAIDAIGLFEGGLSELCDMTIAVTAPEKMRVARLMTRDGITREEATARIRAQKPESYFKEKCDYVLENTGTQVDFQVKCLAFFQNLSIIKKDN